MGRTSDEPVGQASGEFVEAVAEAAGMTADLLVKDQRGPIGHHPDHRQLRVLLGWVGDCRSVVQCGSHQFRRVRSREERDIAF